MRFLFITYMLAFSTLSVFGQDVIPRYLNSEFHKVTLQVINVVPQSNEHAVVRIKEVERIAETGDFEPLVGEYFMVTFYYTTTPTRQQDQFKELGFDFPGVKPGDIIRCQLLGNPSQSDSTRPNWKIFEYVVTGRANLPGPSAEE